MSISRRVVTSFVAVMLGGCAGDEGDGGSASTGSLAESLTVDSCGGPPTVSNGGFETGTLAGWSRHARAAVVPRHHSGTRGVRLARAVASLGHNYVEQTIHVPARSDGTSSFLSFWFLPNCSVKPDRFITEVWTTAGEKLALLSKNCTATGIWEPLSVDLTAWAGLDVVVRFDHYDDGVAETPSYTYVDDIQVLTEVAPPSVVISDPADGDNVGHLATVTASARVSACSALDHIDFYADGVLVGAATASPGTVEWNAGTAPAAHTLLARAFDTAGNSAEHSIDVTAPCGSDPVWTATAPFAGATPPVTAAVGTNGFDLDGVPQSALFMPTASTVHAHDAASGADLGSLTTAAPVERPSLPVEVGTGAAAVTYVFIASSDGNLYRQEMVGGAMAPSGSRGLHRPGCSSDSLSATPTIQLKRFASAGYTLPGDTLFVITHHACGDHTQNQIFAFDAGAPMDSPPLWTFNEFGEYQVDFSTGGCTVDDQLNRLYCATARQPSSNQPSVWGIDVNTGNPVWSVNAGSVLGRPVLNPVSRHLFVATDAGGLRALDPDSAVNGTVPIDWSLPVAAAGSGFRADIWAEHRGNLADRVFAVDTSGILYMVRDQGTSGSVAWSFTPPLGELFTGGPVVKMAGGQGLVYLGTDQGRMFQLRPGPIQATIDAVRAVGGAGNETAGALLLPNALIATSQAGAGGTVTKRFCAPAAIEPLPF